MELLSWKDKLKILESPEMLAREYKMLSMPSAESVIYFIDNWCFTYDPRLPGKKNIPFVLYPKQREFIRWLWARYMNQEEGVVDKCRTAGFSWLTMAFSVYLILFRMGESVGVFSKKATDVHNLKDISSLMAKADYIIKRLPASWTAGVSVNLFHIYNSKSESDISGSSGDNPGRSQRRSIFFGDEAAFYEHAELIEAAVTETANCKIWGSTHSGTNTLFYRKATGGVLPVFVFDWWDNPNLDQAWFNKKKEKAEAEGTLHIFKREIERNAAASVDAVLIPAEWVAAARLETHEGTRKIAALDLADEGGDTNALVITEGNGVIYLEERAEGDPVETGIWAFWKAAEYGCEEFRFDANGVGAGCKGAIKQVKAQIEAKEDKTELDEAALKMKITPYFDGGAVQRPDDLDFNDTPNSEFFENRKAQDYFTLMFLFLNTYRKQNGQDYDEDKIISLDFESSPVYNKLVNEISQPQRGLSSRGKTIIKKKPNGSKSPNLADALKMAMSQVEPEFIPWSII